MPTYDYECRACGNAFEQFQSITAGVLRKCPACGKLKLRRLIGSGAGIIFKGTGFYETDYKKKSGPRTAGTASSSSDSGSKASDNGKSDAKASETKSADKKSSDTKKD